MEIADQLLQPFQTHVELFGYFLLCRIAMKARLASRNCALVVTPHASKRSRPPIALTKTVEDGAANAEPGIALNRNSFARIVFSGRIHQAQDSVVHKIFQKHFGRQTVPNLPCNANHERQIGDHKLIALYFAGLDCCRNCLQ
jgi:hypothetical protein